MIKGEGVSVSSVRYRKGGLAIICDEAYWWAVGGLKKGNYSVTQLLNSLLACLVSR